MTPIRTLRPFAKVVLSTQSDERLVALVREGREDAFAEIVRRHRPGLERLARSLGMGDRADDVVQDGLVRAWKALQRSGAEIDLRPWLTTIVRNRAYSAHSGTRIHEELDETIDGVRQPGDIVLMREELRSAVSAVNSLPDSQREALVRSALSGESHDQIASALATTPGAVRQLIFRARLSLREAVGAIFPFPLVRALAEAGGAGGAVAGGTAVALSAGGASLGLKALAVVVVGATVAGSGIAIERQASGAEAKELSGQTTTHKAATTASDASAAAAIHEAAPTEESTAAKATTAAEAAAAAPEKAADASPSSALSVGESSGTDSTRVAESDSGGDGGGSQTEASQPQAQPQEQPPHQAVGGHAGPPRSGDYQQPPPQLQEQPPPPPPPTRGDTGGRHQHPGFVQQSLDGDGEAGDFVPAP